MQRRVTGLGGRALRRAAPSLAVAGCLLLGVVGRAAATTSTPPSGDLVMLSNETTHTTFTEANARAWIRTRPTDNARRITRLRYYTPDLEAVQTYLLLAEEQVGGREWVRLRIPMRPNGRIGWVLRSALAQFQTVDTEIVVNRRKFRLTVYRDGRKVFQTRVGVGHFHNPTRPTPPGHFWITEAFPSSDPFYGPWAFGTSDYAHDTDFPDGSIVGIHGTDQPQLIPGDPSHGCIRLKDPDILKLKRLVGIGTPVWVQ